MTFRLLRFPDLQARNVVGNRVQLDRLIREHNFPPGRMVSPNIRAWEEQEIADWFRSRPVEGPEARGAAKLAKEGTRPPGRKERANPFESTNRDERATCDESAKRAERANKAERTKLRSESTKQRAPT
jgi:predicted DNA-binding transcriptional regulator AlpA